MKQKFVYQSLAALAAALLAMTAAVSCTPNDEHEGTWDDSVMGTATVSGVVKDTFDNPLSDVDVTFMGTSVKRDVRKTAKTGSDGTFSVASVPSNARFITFSKEGYATVAYTIAATRFVNEDNIVLNPVLEYSQAVIKGSVFNAEDGKPWAGVSVSCGTASATTGADGSFSLEGLTINNYTVTFTAEGLTYSKKVNASDFIDGVVELPAVRLGGPTVLPGMTFQDLADCDPWYGNNYRGSDGFGGINHWSCGYMSAFNYWGNWRYEAEGCALFNDPTYGAHGGTEFNSYMYGRKRIEEGNKIMCVLVRTHYASGRDPAHFNVAVVNLTDGSTTAEYVGEQTHGDGNYKSYYFDLSPWVGKEVAIAFGLYYTQKTETKYHLPVRRVCFASEQVNQDDPLTGSAIEGAAWRCFTRENLTSMTPNEKTSFTGKNMGFNSTDSFDVSPNDSRISPRHKHNFEGGQQGYNLWTGTNHLAVNWMLQYVSKDVEPVNQEGYTIKTRSDVDANYETPESYLYSRFSITDANDQLHFRFRTFSSANPTVFRVTAVPLNTCKAEALTPVSNSAISAKATTNGCWEFVHEKGNGVPTDYAEFVYDLSKFKGQDVVIALGVHKGATRDGEQKLCIYSIDMD